ncbi:MULTISPECIES: CHAD domain-containing protein [Pseudomonas]|uniref:CHAD domain-containing protein n=1 Tax=Pseudomonas TaxID=286 RepID=UPI0002FBD354|nr:MULTISPECIES: CHAD domain-containing protein [Pseudomonas]MDC7828826.1 CHAD domain-containing protein [Pseudomonas benzopyrenica]MXS18128.1 CHAD domain-containing protein [Pseudomonas oryzihabitans]
MAFRFDARQAADEEVRRVVTDRLVQAETSLASGTPKGVHETRKRLKELRALLRLLHGALGKRAFVSRNRRLRDLGRQLSSLRDSAALVESWDKLGESDRKRFASPAMKRVRQRLQERADQQIAAASGHPELLEELTALREEVAGWKLSGKGFGLFARGLEDNYKAGRQALKTARDKPTDETLHDWRKRVKDHWYHTQLLAAAWPAEFKTRQKSLKRLSEYLGDDHDLAVMQLLLESEPTLFGASNTRLAIGESLAQQRERLQLKAFSLGLRLYLDKPTALAERWRDLWRLASRPYESRKAKPKSAKAPAGLLPHLVEESSV